GGWRSGAGCRPKKPRRASGRGRRSRAPGQCRSCAVDQEAPQPLVRDVRVDSGRLKPLVPEQLLDLDERGAVLEQFRGERMAQQVGMAAELDAGLAAAAGEHLAD